MVHDGWSRGQTRKLIERCVSGNIFTRYIRSDTWLALHPLTTDGGARG